MRRLFIMTLGLYCAVALMGCKADATNASESKTVTESQTSSVATTDTSVAQSGEDSPVLGGWSISEKLSPSENSNAMRAFDMAVKNLEGYSYEVVAVLGSQTVSGTNYSYLCKGIAVTPDAKAEYAVVNVYEDLSGNAKITGSLELLEGKEGWEYNEGSAKLEDNTDAKTAFDKSLEALAGANYEPIAYIGKKDNSYAILVKISTVTPDPQITISMVYVTSTDSGAMIDDIKDVDISADTTQNT